MFKIKLETLFSAGKIGNVKIKNRIVRSSTFENMANLEGHVTDKLIKFHTNLAQGGTGLIVTGLTGVLPDSKVSNGGACLCDDSCISGQKKLVNAVHEYSEVKIASQLAHTGPQNMLPKIEPVGPSAVQEKITKRVSRVLTEDEVRDIIKKFVDATRRAYECGYDMVQYNAGHGWLLSSFLSPYRNKRTDDFGGDTQKRARILIDIYNQSREEVGKKFPIILKLQTQDGIPEGMDFEEGKKIAKIMVDTGYDAIEPSAGLSETIMNPKNPLPSIVIKSEGEENFFLPIAKALKPLMKDSKLIFMGGVKFPSFAEKILKEEIADFISMSRPLIREPGLPNRWKGGDTSPATCISCNSCYTAILTGKLHCVVQKKLDRKKKREEKALKAEIKE